MHQSKEDSGNEGEEGQRRAEQLQGAAAAIRLGIGCDKLTPAGRAAGYVGIGSRTQ